MGYPSYFWQSQKIYIPYNGGLRKWTKDDFTLFSYRNLFF